MTVEKGYFCRCNGIGIRNQLPLTRGTPLVCNDSFNLWNRLCYGLFRTKCPSYEKCWQQLVWWENYEGSPKIVRRHVRAINRRFNRYDPYSCIPISFLQSSCSARNLQIAEEILVANDASALHSCCQFWEQRYQFCNGLYWQVPMDYR